MDSVVCFADVQDGIQCRRPRRRDRGHFVLMREERAESVGGLVAIEGVRGEVHTVLPSAVYLATAQGPMLVVHDRSHGHTPSSLLVRHARPVEWGIRPGDVVAGRAGRLRVGPVVVDARRPARWLAPAPSVPLALADAASLRRHFRHDAPCGFEGLDASCLALAAALADGSVATTAAAVRALVGSGPGLTPSGDDALVGLLALVHRSIPPALGARPLELLRTTVPSLLGRTTDVSAHYLRLALDAWFGEHLTNFVDSLGRSASEGALPNAGAVLATGATSGADALVGVMAGLAMLGASSSCDIESVS